MHINGYSPLSIIRWKLGKKEKVLAKAEIWGKSLRKKTIITHIEIKSLVDDFFFPFYLSFKM